jgi:hypothetical protein
MMLNNLIDRVGDWNPQIFRELKERLKLKNIGLATGGSILIQGFVWFYFYSQIPVTIVEKKNGASWISIVPEHSRYCLTDGLLNHNYHQTGLCTLNSLGGVHIHWQRWWSDVFQCMSWILPLGLIVGAVYLLVADLVQEEKRGTLNFIRLSPQSTQTIFMGKILGIPILVYLAVAVMLPFHLFAGITAGGNIPLLAAWYLTIGSIWFLCSSAAVLYVLLGGSQAILTVPAVGYLVGIPLLAINYYASGTINHDSLLDYGMKNMPLWFWLPVASSAIGFYIFGIGCCMAATYWVWQTLERRYLNPTATVLSKFQSYQINLLLGIWFAGFAIPIAVREMSMNDKGALIISMAIVHFMALFTLIPLLLPSKQALLDWSRYRREHVTHQHRSFWQRDLVQDLIRNDKSPALLALAINLGMAIALWLPVGLITFTRETYGIRFVAGLCLGASLTMIYATIAHWVLFLNLKKRNLWLVAIVGGVMILPIGFAIVISHNSQPMGLAAILLLFSPLAPVGILGLSGGSILATFGAQLALLAGLTRQFQRKLQVSGQSQSKRVLLTE